MICASAKDSLAKAQIKFRIDANELKWDSNPKSITTRHRYVTKLSGTIISKFGESYPSTQSRFRASYPHSFETTFVFDKANKVAINLKNGSVSGL